MTSRRRHVRGSKNVHETRKASACGRVQGARQAGKFRADMRESSGCEAREREAKERRSCAPQRCSGQSGRTTRMSVPATE
eukprot:1085256-Rhodomonas_salina.5